MRFFSSDLHFGHENIIKYCNRPFADAEEMNIALIENWNNTVDVDDEVFVLGDVAMGKIYNTLPLVGLLNGTKHLIAGNHDRCWVGHSKAHKSHQMYLDAGFATVEMNGLITLENGDPVFLNHFPFSGDSHDGDRFDYYRPEDLGTTLLHGHVHDVWKVRESDAGTLQINVGCDVHNYRPISEADIISIIQSLDTDNSV